MAPDSLKQADDASINRSRTIDRYIIVQLDFDTVDAAEASKGFLETVGWESPDLSPGLAGTPSARVLRKASGYAQTRSESDAQVTKSPIRRLRARR